MALDTDVAEALTALERSRGPVDAAAEPSVAPPSTLLPLPVPRFVHEPPGRRRYRRAPMPPSLPTDSLRTEALSG